MEIIFLLLLVSLLVASGFLLAYLNAARTGQFDDDYTPAIRILLDTPVTGSDTAQESPPPMQEESQKEKA